VPLDASIHFVYLSKGLGDSNQVPKSLSDVVDFESIYQIHAVSDQRQHYEACIHIDIEQLQKIQDLSTE